MKINDENRELIRADLGTMTRKAICEKWGVDYHMLQKEYGFTHKKGPRKTATQPNPAEPETVN